MPFHANSILNVNIKQLKMCAYQKPWGAQRKSMTDSDYIFEHPKKIDEAPNAPGKYH